MQEHSCPSRRAWRLVCVIAALCAAAFTCATAAAGSPATLKLATWNMEWLLSSETLRSLEQRCAAGGARLPCDVPARFMRGVSDFAVLARYARELDADVVALQEVEGEAVARRVFGGYEFCFTARHDPQNVGFAIRRGIPFRCDPDLVELSLHDRVRRGAQLVLAPGTGAELHLLAVHLKSGCATGTLQDPPRRDDACALLARQGAPLRGWIEAQVRAGHAFAVLGDFNRQLVPPGAAQLGALLHDPQPERLALTIAGVAAPFEQCHAGQYFPAPIDFIVLGERANAKLVTGSFARLTYRAADAHRHILSDHCPVAIRLRLS